MGNVGGGQDDKKVKKPNLNKNHRQRVKDKFLHNGLECFADHEVLEFLLFYTIQQADTNPQGHLLMERFKSISGVFDAEYDMLCEVDGIGEQSALLIKFFSSLYKRYAADYASKLNSIRSSDEAKAFMRGYLSGGQRESMYMACMGNNGKVLYFKRIAAGEPDTVSVVPSDIVKLALRANAVRVVLGHNHPLGICNPSGQDLRMTSIISDELRRVGVELFDHVIVAADGVYSMREKDMLPSYKG